MNSLKKTKEETELTRKNILKSALKLFSTKGYTLTTLQDIATDSNVTRGAVYHHFKDKTDLYKAVIAENLEPINSEFLKLFTGKYSILESIEIFMIEYLKLLEENESYRLVMELTLLKTEVTNEIHEMMEEKQIKTQELLSFLSKLLSKGIIELTFRSDLNPYLTSVAILSYLVGLASFYLVNSKPFSAKNDSNYLIKLFTRSLL